MSDNNANDVFRSFQPPVNYTLTEWTVHQPTYEEHLDHYNQGSYTCTIPFITAPMSSSGGNKK